MPKVYEVKARPLAPVVEAENTKPLVPSQIDNTAPYDGGDVVTMSDFVQFKNEVEMELQDLRAAIDLLSE